MHLPVIFIKILLPVICLPWYFPLHTKLRGRKRIFRPLSWTIRMQFLLNTMFGGRKILSSRLSKIKNRFYLAVLWLGSSLVYFVNDHIACSICKRKKYLLWGFKILNEDSNFKFTGISCRLTGGVSIPARRDVLTISCFKFVLFLKKESILQEHTL